MRRFKQIECFISSIIKVRGPISGFFESHIKIKKSAWCVIDSIFSNAKNIYSIICYMVLFIIISAENLIAPPPPSATGALFNYFSLKENLIDLENNHMFPHFYEIRRYFSAFIFSLTKKYIFEYRNLSKNLFHQISLDFGKKLKIDHFRYDISGFFPISYDRIYKKFLKLEFFINNFFFFFFSEIFFNFYIFIIIQDLGPDLPPSKLGLN